MTIIYDLTFKGHNRPCKFIYFLFEFVIVKVYRNSRINIKVSTLCRHRLVTQKKIKITKTSYFKNFSRFEGDRRFGMLYPQERMLHLPLQS